MPSCCIGRAAIERMEGLRCLVGARGRPVRVRMILTCRTSTTWLQSMLFTNNIKQRSIVFHNHTTNNEHAVSARHVVGTNQLQVAGDCVADVLYHVLNARVQTGYTPDMHRKGTHLVNVPGCEVSPFCPLTVTLLHLSSILLLLS